ncbi:yjeF N-terminal region [Agromyces sp. CF514]|uniref:NAD(P)H-hydrate epimerase n=1 Tax=Agromyces sp. CF514 TaxID=1881031 RepID=UPI0008E49B6C|nr:NAD(P)H-hydrate epimerase [Agromyces sp. CF514]SFR91460.1 yjeF N-terminal region [Agromyces sp. CF514]
MDEPRAGPEVGYTAEQVRAAERPLLDRGEPLMHRAAAALADEISELLRTTDAAADRHRAGPLVLVLAGSGDNGGDALFAAAHLAERGADVRVVAVGSRLHEAGAGAARAAGARRLRPDADRAGFAATVARADVIVDGILGIGAAASPALRGPARDVVACIRTELGQEWIDRAGGGTRHPLVVAVDLPSGISPDDGSVPDPTVLPADVTVTMGAVKAGLLLEPAVGLVGRVVLVDLGLGPALAGVRSAVRRGRRRDPS